MISGAKPAQPRSHTSQMWFALWLVYIIWGSTYLCIAIAVKTMPSLMSMGVRFLVASILLALLVGIRQGWRQLRVPRREVANSMTFGGAMLGVGIGSVSLAERFVPSGIIALIISAMPLWVSLFGFLAGRRPGKLSWLGVAIGFLGVALLLRPGHLKAPVGTSSSQLLFWICVVLVSNFIWALGTYLSPRREMPKNSFVLTVYQMVAGGVTLFVAGVVRGEHFSQFIHASATSWLGWSYLATIGSVVAYSAYLWLVANAPVNLTATYGYVNPIIAVALGALILNEPITTSMIFGAGVIITGVVLVITAENRAKV